MSGFDDNIPVGCHEMGVFDCVQNSFNNCHMRGQSISDSPFNRGTESVMPMA